MTASGVVRLAVSNLSGVPSVIFGLFGSSTWNGAGVKNLIKFMEENNLQALPAAAELSGSFAPEKIGESAVKLVEEVDKAIKSWK